MNNSNTTAPPNFEIVFYYFHLYGLPVVMFSGLLGNALSVIVCLSPRLRRIPSSIYLTALALYDSVALIMYVLLWVEFFDLAPNETEIGCRLIGYLLNVAGCLSAWSVAAFSLERFVVVYYPLRRASICTTRKAKTIILAQLPYPLLINLPYFFIMSTEPMGCDVRNEFRVFNNVLGILDAVFSCLFPVFIICIVNFLIIRRLAKVRKR